MILRTLPFAALVALAGPVLALADEAPNPQAEALNDEGKTLYRDKNYPAAVAKFNEAIQLSPDARYYFNLCATQEKLEDYDAALEACDAVYAHSPKDDLKAKTGQRAAEIRQKKRERDSHRPPPPPYGDNAGTGTGGTGTGGTGTGGAGTGGTGTGGAGTGGTGTGGTGTTGTGGTGGNLAYNGGTGGGAPPPPYGGGGAGAGAGAPASQVEAQSDPRGKYRWSLGFDIGPVFNRGVGDQNIFGKSGTMFRGHIDWLIAPRWHIGLQGFIGGQTFNADSTQNELTIADVGGALYWHRRLTPSLYLTPLAGAQFAGLQPYRNADESFATFGFRFELGLQWVLGGGHHVISIIPFSLNTYLPAAANTTGGTDPSEWGFDTGGATWSISIGYTYRFTKSFLPSIVVLE